MDRNRYQAESRKKRVLVCNKEKCEKVAVLTLRLETDRGPEFMAFCKAHLLTAAEAIKMIHKMVEGTK